jgi:hypothetical protein
MDFTGIQASSDNMISFNLAGDSNKISINAHGAYEYDEFENNDVNYTPNKNTTGEGRRTAQKKKQDKTAKSISNRRDRSRKPISKPQKQSQENYH